MTSAALITVTIALWILALAVENTGKYIATAIREQKDRTNG